MNEACIRMPGVHHAGNALAAENSMVLCAVTVTSISAVYGSWRSIVGPKGLTPAQVTFWENALRKVVESADWKAELERYVWGNYFFTIPTLRKNLDKEYADSKAVLVELGLAKQ